MKIISRLTLRLTIPLFLIILALLAEGYTMRHARSLADADEEKEACSRVTQEMAELQEIVNYRLRNEDWEGIQSVIAQRGADPDIVLLVLWDDAGTIIGATRRELVGVPASQTLPDAGTAKEVRTTLAGRVLLSGDRTLVTAYYPVVIGAKERELRPNRVGILFMRYDLTIAKAIRRHEVERRALAMAGFYTGCFALLGLFLHLFFTRRVNRLVNVASRIAAGDLSVRTGFEGEDELARIGMAFDRMAEKIADDQSELKEKEARYHALFEAVPDALMIADLETGTVRDANSSASRLFLLPREKLVGMHQSALHPPRIGGQAEDSFREHAQEAAEGRVSGPFEHLILRSDGAEILVEIVTQPVMLDGKRMVQGAFRDISERKRTEENLRLLNERFVIAADAAGFGVWDWDIIKNELVWDDRMYELYGVREQDFTRAYEAWLGGLHPDDRAASVEVSELARRGERQYDTEFRVVWPDGSIHHLKAYGQVIRAANGEPVRMTGVNYDISGLKQAEENLRALNDELEKRVSERTAELEKKNADLEQMNKLFVGRELRMMELKERIRELENLRNTNAPEGNAP